MTGTSKTVPRKRRRSALLRVVSGIVVVLLALVVSYTVWTVYENTLTPAALNQGPPINTKASSRGELSPTAARALKAYGGEAVWKDATPPASTMHLRGTSF